MELIYNTTSKRFETISTYEEKDIPKGAGFRWDSDARRWTTGDVTTAIKLKEYANADALKVIQAHAEKINSSLAASSATSSDIAVPAPAGMVYYPHQLAAVEYAANRKAVAICDEMGVGKTASLIGIINYKPEIKKALIVVPAGLRLNWMRELANWLVRSDLKVVRYNKKETLPTENCVVILGYEEATKLADTLGEWDLVGFDEAHYLKNPKAKRTKALLALKTKQWIFLTGTPVLNRPIELWPLLQKIDPQGLGSSWKNYAYRYCAAKQGKFGMDVSGASNLEELNIKLRLGGMIRRTKAQVLTHLPSKIRNLIALEPDAKAKKLIKAQKEQALKEAKAKRQIKQLQRQDPEKFSLRISKLKEGAEVAFQEISRIRHQLALLKVPQVIAHVLDAVENGPVILFAHHEDVVGQLQTALNEKDLKTACITGSTPQEKRQQAVDVFQAGNLDVIICSIKAAGVGITLTKSSHVIFAELDWTPGWVQQAEDRAHRIGQEEVVVADWLVLDDSLEAKMAKTLRRKLAITTKATGDVSSEKAAPLLEITEDDFAKAEANAEVKKQEEERKQAMQKEHQELLKTVPTGHYLLLNGEEAKIKYGQVFGYNGLEKDLEILREIAVDPHAAGKAYADKTGKCYCCNRRLTDAPSLFIGLGPDCGHHQHRELEDKTKRLKLAITELTNLIHEEDTTLINLAA